MKRRRLIILAAGLAIGALILAKLSPRMTEADVLRVAEPVLEAEYPDSFSEGRPYHAKFSQMTRVWHVRGTLPPRSFGGTPEAKVDDADGRILHVTHTQ